MTTDYTSITTSAEWLCSTCGRPRAAHECGGFQRRHHDFVGMLRIKNEERWIGDAIRSIHGLCDRIFILDDHSTDKTVEICQSFEKITLIHSPFSGLNEARDKNFLYDQIMAHCEPSWILAIDGDEVLETSGPATIRDSCRKADANEGEYGLRKSFALQIAFLWNSPNTVRVDRIYRDFWRPSLFKPFVERLGVPDDRKLLQEFRFMSTPFGRHTGSDQPNLHCSSVPQRRIHGRGICPVRLKHYGYMDRADRVRKLDYYTSIDWKNDSEGWYRHMCQGDNVQPDELPRANEMYIQGVLADADLLTICAAHKDAALLHAGPLEVIPWSEDERWPVSDWARREHATR